MPTFAHKDGFTMMEILVVIAIITILASIGVISFDNFNNRSANSSQEISATLMGARSRAMQNMNAVSVEMQANGTLMVQQAPRCKSATETWVNVESLNYTPPPQVTLSSSSPWRVCFNSRGLADQTASLIVTDTKGHSRTVNVYLSGAVEVP